MRRQVTLWAIAAGLATVAAPAQAADQTVHAVDADDYSGARFAPAYVQIAPGESVTWVNDGGLHNVRFEDELFTAPAVPAPPEAWPVPPPKRTFAQAGTYRYYCQAHGGPAGFGMAGVVQVGAAGTPSTGGGPPGSGSGSPTSTAHVRIESASVTRRRFCNRRGPRCRRPGVRLRIDLSHPAQVKGTLRRRPLRGSGRVRRFGTVDFGTVAAGRRTLRFRRTATGRALTRGRYSLTLKAGQDTAVLTFRIVS